jgi:hypothetical protein
MTEPAHQPNLIKLANRIDHARSIVECASLAVEGLGIGRDSYAAAIETVLGIAVDELRAISETVHPQAADDDEVQS